ncbi:nucleotidyl transferase AbiEii/AbiGii toxin family protein [Carnobacterium sp. TMP28]|uniref:nucleotidyl transferase AbiEii/AbiGii toxin family protein n=1 Tax=Carnobacterium sp. TMP28 TaxID=3397060 RepID=UPI0039E15EA2
MRLHEDKEVFKEIISATAGTLNFEEFQIEKDYYVSLLLKKLVEVSPEIVFKGGTSLSKCYDVINRFSEDIDITIKIDKKVSNKERKKFKKDILKAINEVDFELLNEKVNPPIETRSRRDFNKYLVGYQREFIGGDYMVDHIIVETNVTYLAFPFEKIEVSNYITKYLLSNDEQWLIEKYQIEPFEMQVQKIERTFIDKLFAICNL